MKERGIFVKVFLYTMLFLMLVISVTAVLFAQQIVSFYNKAQIQLLNENFSQLSEQLARGESSDYFRIAQEFSDKNQSFRFEIQDPDGYKVFSSVRITNNENAKQFHNLIISVGPGYTLSASADTLDSNEYSQLFGRIFIGLALLLVLGVLGSIIFARQMTKPIKELVRDAETMSKLEPVRPPEKRSDEIGELSYMIHEMYGKLKDTIAELKEEKETQRYFFSAASHELKTPIAATTALLQGMLDDIGEYKEHPKYLWECLKMMKEQNKIITEILEIVKLTDAKIKPDFQKLSLWSAVEAVLPSCQALIETKEQVLEIQIPKEQVVMTDDRMLNRVLSNVIINAVQNTPQQGTIRIWSESGEEFVRLCILNTGVRIDDNILPKLFDPFYRIDEARSANYGRSGLGLTIVARTLECMGLSFALENIPEGVLFWIDFCEQ